MSVTENTVTFSQADLMKKPRDGWPEVFDGRWLGTWNPGNAKPEKPGVYVRCIGVRWKGIDGFGYSYWDGKQWGKDYCFIHEAEQHKAGWRAMLQFHPWAEIRDFVAMFA